MWDYFYAPVPHFSIENRWSWAILQMDTSQTKPGPMYTVTLWRWRSGAGLHKPVRWWEDRLASPAFSRQPSPTLIHYCYKTWGHLEIWNRSDMSHSHLKLWSKSICDCDRCSENEVDIYCGRGRTGTCSYPELSRVSHKDSSKWIWYDVDISAFSSKCLIRNIAIDRH